MKKGEKMSEEQKIKIGNANRGRKISEEHRLALVKAHTGKKLSEETKRKLSILSLGRKHTEESKQKMRDNSVGRKGKTNSLEMRTKMSNTIKKMFANGLLNTHTKTGSESNFWKDGRSKDKKYVSWSKNKRNRLKQTIIKELGSHTYAEWENLKKQYNYTCPCCKLSEQFNGQKSLYLTEDHIIPLSKGGSDLIENIQPLCLNCNIKKNNKIIKYG